MNKLKIKISITLLLVLCMNMLAAQQTKIFNQNASGSNHARLGFSPSFISISVGRISAKDDLLGNRSNVQADVFVPFYSKNNNFAWGLNILANYASIKNLSPDNNAVANRYQVYSAKNTVSTVKHGAMSNNFSGLAGIQALFGIGRFYISPLACAGYSHFTLQGFTQAGTYTANGQTQQKDLVKREKQSFGVLIFKPQLRFGYSVSSSFSLFASSAYITGPEIKVTTTSWVPQGGFNANNIYEAQQMQNGSWANTKGSEKYKAWGINLGLTMAIGKKKAVKSSGIGGMSKPGGAVSSSYARTVATSSEKDSTGSDYTQLEARNNNTMRSNRTDNALKTGAGNADLDSSFQLKMQNIGDSNSMPSRLSMTPTTARQTQGKTFGEKVASGLQAGAAMVKPGSPIGGIVVKGGKNPGGNAIKLVTDENGEITFTVTEAGSYTFRITFPEAAEASERRVEVLKSNTTGNPNPPKNKRETRTYTGGRKNEIPDNAAIAKPGSPIGGIVVKGGKNPSPGNGWGAIHVISNDNGEITFTVNEPGEYKLQITAPEAPGKSINEKGVSGSKPTKSKPTN